MLVFPADESSIFRASGGTCEARAFNTLLLRVFRAAIEWASAIRSGCNCGIFPDGRPSPEGNGGFSRAAGRSLGRRENQNDKARMDELLSLLLRPWLRA